MLVWYNGKSGKPAMARITFAQTAGGNYLVKLASSGDSINLSSERLAELVPDIGAGCGEIPSDVARQLLLYGAVSA